MTEEDLDWESEFDAMDKDKDGKIEFEDFIRFTWAGNASFISILRKLICRWAFQKRMKEELLKKEQQQLLEEGESSNDGKNKSEGNGGSQ